MQSPGAFGEPILPAPPGGEKQVKHNTTCLQLNILLWGELNQIYSPHAFLVVSQASEQPLHVPVPPVASNYQTRDA